MPFLTYKDARPWAKAIREGVSTRKMRPWPADSHFGKFSNDRSLCVKRSIPSWPGPITARKQAILRGMRTTRSNRMSLFRSKPCWFELMPHMHLRGKDFIYTAFYPTGESEVLLRVPKYDFSWQLFYDQKVLPAGTRVHCVAHFDTSPQSGEPRCESGGALG